MSPRAKLIRENEHGFLRRRATPATNPNLYNYSADAGAGSATFTQSRQEGDANWRATLLGTVAAGALFFGYGRTARAAPDGCVTVAGVTTCQGDQSDGITSVGGAADFDPTVTTTLNVNSLTQDIAPAAADGIYFSSANNITIVSDTGNFAINATGVGARGIFAYGGDMVSVTSTGDVSGRNGGIFARGGVDGVTITSTGDVTSTYGAVIYGSSLIGGVTINSEGDVRSQYGLGIVANSGFNTVTVISDGDINTLRHGILANSSSRTVTVESTGDIFTTGEGGAGIYAIGYDGVTVQQTGDITTQGIFTGAFSPSFGIFAYSDDGSVGVTLDGNITTSGDETVGILAIAGGSIEIMANGNITTTGDEADGIFANAYDVTVQSEGDISTQGNRASGIFASAYSDVTVQSEGDISTQGNRAYGIYVDSYNGSITITQTGDITTSGSRAYGISVYSYNGGEITIEVIGDVTTSGEDADGISAFSRTGGPITVEVTGDVTVTGVDADGIDVDNPFGADFDSKVTINAGSTITGGTDGGDGIDFNGGRTNVLINYGTITTRGENAIEGEDGGAEKVYNYGTVTGNVHLDDGENSFFNGASGVFNTADTAFLGVGNLLTNAGTLSPGGTGTLQTTALTGNLLQSGSGIFAVDMDVIAATSDLLNVTGTAKLAGNVLLQVVNPSMVTQQTTILSAVGGTTNNGLGLIASPALQAELLYPNANDVVVSVSIDFSPSGLNSNQTSIGNNLNLTLGAGGGSLGSVYDGLLNGVFTLSDYMDALDQLSPEIYLNTETATLFFAEEFANNMLSCPAAGAGYSVMSEGQCLWVRPEGRLFDRDQTFENIGYEEDTFAISAGAQVALAKDWFGGVAIGYERGSLKNDSAAESRSHRFAAGGVIKYQSGPMVLAAALSGGIADYDTERAIDIGGLSVTATSDHDVRYVGGMARAAYLMKNNGGWYAKPLVDVNVTYVDRDGVTERGGGAANLTVAGGSETFFSVTPAIELGTEFAHSAGGVVRPFIRAGVTFYEDDGHALSASFSGAPGSVGNFRISTEFDDVFADLEAGVSAIYEDGSSLSFGYEGRLSENTQQHGFFVKGTMKY